MNRLMISAGVAVAAAAILAIAFCVGPDLTRDPESGGRRLAIHDAVQRRIDPTTIEYDWDDAPLDAVIRLGQVPNPASVITSAESETAVLVALFEPTAKAVRIYDIDKITLAVREHVIDPGYISYGIVPDRDDPDRFFVVTSEPAQLVVLDRIAGRQEVLHAFNAGTKIFSVAQSNSGSILIGTYPDARLLEVEVSGARRASCTELAFDRSQIGDRRYLHRIIVPGDGRTYLHFGSPGVLFELTDSVSRLHEVTKTDAPFLSAAELAAATGFDPDSIPGHSVTSAGFAATVTLGAHRVELSLAPLRAGCHISALVSGGNGIALGNTYWNHWFFTLDVRSKRLEAHGPAGECGEFFAAGPFGSGVLIPHYQGTLLYFDPARAFEYRADAKHNPEILAQVRDAHFGTCAVELPDGAAIYATFPNYHQRHGMLIRYERGRGAKPLEHGDFTINRLACVDDRLFGGTIVAHGLGGGSENDTFTRIVELDADDGRVLASVEFAPPTRASVVGLWPTRLGRLIAVTGDGRVHELETRGLEVLRAFDWGRPVTTTGVYDDQHLLLLSSNVIGAVRADQPAPTALFVSPVHAQHMAVERGADVILSSATELFAIRRADIAARLRETVGVGN